MTVVAHAEQPVALDPRVVAIGAASGLSSGAALVAAIMLDRPLWICCTFVFVPGLVALTALSVSLRREQQALFLSRLRSGLVAGLVATAAYDFVRWVIEALSITSTNSFIAIRVFGSGLTGGSPLQGSALAAGWLFHIVNGLGFALAYMFLAAGRPRWLAVLYALVLESFIILLYPRWLGFTLSGEFLSVSIMGHVAYGVVLGAAAARSQ